jgi:DNA topoisomerase-1
MEKYFTRLVDYEFTARLEDDLDAIARGEADNQSYLKEFYFGNGHAGLKSLVASGEETIDPREVCGLALGEDGSGNHLEVRIGRYGPFITNGTDTASLPPTIAPDEINAQKAEELLLEAAKGPTSLGEDPESSKPIYLKTGRYGPYIQLGDQEDGVKPRMVSLLPGMKPEDVTYEISLKLLKFPRSLGNHPQTGEEVLVATGRYGPYIKSGAETRSIPMDQLSPLDLSMEDAVELLKQPRKRGRASYKPQTVKDLGKHGDKTISLKTGRYGPYVTDGKINAALPKGQDPESLTPEQALELIVQKSAK